MCAGNETNETAMAVATPTEMTLEQTAVPNNIFSDIQSFENAQRMAKLLSMSDFAPERYRGKIANCVVAIDIANRMGISPLTAMQNLYFVHGSPSWSGQACRALIEHYGKFTDIDLVYIGEQGKPSWGCYMQAKRKTDGAVIKGATVTMEMAQKEGWEGKSGSKWKTMPELMMAYRAATFFARMHCPSVMMGFQTKEELQDIGTVEEEHIPTANSVSIDDI